MIMEDREQILQKINFISDIAEVIKSAKSIQVIHQRRELVDIIFGSDDNELAEIKLDVPGQGEYLEGTIARCKNGYAVNFVDTYMRRRDPEAMVIGDDRPTDKKTFQERFGKDFANVRKDTLEWLKQQDLLMVPFYSGNERYGYLSVALIPRDVAFFALVIADLQGFVQLKNIKESSKPSAMLLVAPIFRHTHFDGKQVVVHQRTDVDHTVFAYNLYPGPSAKKGVYSVLLNIGEREKPQWSTLHCSTVRVVTPYECELVIMHEGASGGGKTEMTQQPHLRNGRLHFARNVDTDDEIVLTMVDKCELYPITDDMGLVHPTQQESKKLSVEDAEDSWFLRVDHLTSYGTDPELEGLCINPPEPFVYLNIDAKPGATALLWDHIMDDIDKPCPNPRIILPRKYIPQISNGPIEVDIRSFGVRAPRCTKEQPTYGIFGMFQVLPASLAWLWRLVAPRGHANPSIVSDGKGIISEGVGSYWPFAIGKKIEQANLLLHQILGSEETKYMLIPNQFIGSYHVGFSGQWVSREYIARRGGLNFKKGQLIPTRCPLLGYTPIKVLFNNVPIPKGLLQVNMQLKVGNEAYDQGATELTEFFKKELDFFRKQQNLDPLGKQIIDICMDGGSSLDYVKATPFSAKSMGIEL